MMEIDGKKFYTRSDLLNPIDTAIEMLERDLCFFTNFYCQSHNELDRKRIIEISNSLNCLYELKKKKEN